jgi:thiol-disulfide isomerase/thioredoxin
MDRTIKIAGAILAIVVVGAVLLFSSPFAPQEAPPVYSGNVTVYFFYGEECPHCHNVMPFLENISKKYPQANILYLETWHHPENLAIADSMNQKLGTMGVGVPEIIVGTTVLVGERDIPAKLESVIKAELKKNQ